MALHREPYRLAASILAQEQGDRVAEGELHWVGGVVATDPKDRQMMEESHPRDGIWGGTTERSTILYISFFSSPILFFFISSSF